MMYNSQRKSTSALQLNTSALQNREANSASASPDYSRENSTDYDLLRLRMRLRSQLITTHFTEALTCTPCVPG